MKILSVLATVVFVGALGAYVVGVAKSGSTSLIPAMQAVGVPFPGEVEPSVAQSTGTATINAAPTQQAQYTTGEGEGEVRRLVIGLDLSKSNPLIADPEYAQKVARRIASIVKELGFRSEVFVRTFGSFGGDENTLQLDQVISSRKRPETLAKNLELLIGNTPTLVSQGKWQPQDRTNILGFLDNMAQVIDCSSMSTTYILASDGIEESEYVNLKRQVSLPVPTGNQFSGCDELLILGLGQGTNSPSETSRLRAEWKQWAESAGFKRFSGLNDW
jgi:hypothetical protein